MKKAFYALLATALLFSLAGCGSFEAAKDAAKEEAVSPPSSVQETGSNEQSESTPALSKPESQEASAPVENESTGSPAPSQAQAEPERIPPPAEIPPAREEPPASKKPETPAIKPSEPEPSAPEESESEPSVPEEPVAPVFDIGYWISYGKSYGTGIGLTLDETATACWDNPIRVGAHSKYLQSDISSTLDWYRSSGFTNFWIWAESQGDGTYLYYIGYA